AGSLIVQSTGSTHVGQVVIHGLTRRNHVVGAFGQVRIDGSLGAFTSDTNVGSLTVHGTLGSVSAPGRGIGMIPATTFHTALAHLASLPVLKIDNDPNATALQTLNAAQGSSSSH